MARKTRPIQAVLVATILILWVTGIIAAYYVIHKPWGMQLPVAPFLAVLDIFLSMATIGLAGGLGRRLLSGPAGASPLEGCVLQGAIGLGALGLAWLVFGMFGLLHPAFAWAFLIAGLVWLRREVLAWYDDWKSFLGSSSRPGLINRLALGFVLILIGLNLLQSLAPPLKWDSLVYHLQIPRAYASAGRIFYYAENLYAGFPQTAEMLYTWGMALRSINVAVVLSWAAGLLALTGVDGFARRIAGEQSAWLAPAIVLSGFSLSQALHWAYLDLWIFLFGLCMFIALDLYRVTNHRLWLVLAGAYAGFAISTKYTAGILVLAGAAALLPVAVSPARWQGPGGKTKWLAAWKGLFVELAIFAGMAALLVLPWLFKNLILVGNPLYPVLSAGNSLDPWAQTFQSGVRPDRNFLQDLILPLGLTLFGIESAIVVGWPEYSASIGPLLLALTPGVLFGWKYFSSSQRDSLKRLLLACGATWLIWGMASHFADELMRPRHYYGVFSAWAILAVMGYLSVSRLRVPQVRVERVVGVMLILALGFSLLAELISFVQANPLPVVFGLQSTDDYINQQLGDYGQAVQSIRDLPSSSAVLFLWEPRIFYCQGDCIPDSKLNNWWYLRHKVESAAGMTEILRQRGVTHVLSSNRGAQVVRDTTAEYTAQDWFELESFTRTQLVALEVYGDYTLYQLRFP